MQDNLSPLVERVSFRDSDHSYTLNGKRLPSVTTLLDNLSKPALPWWAATKGAEAVAERVRELDPENIEHWHDVHIQHFAGELFELAQRAHITHRNAAGAKGNAVHAAIQSYHEEFFTAEPPEGENELNAWNAFIAWWSAAGLTAISTERKIVDPDGRYAGRLDLLCSDISGNLFVCDIKTSTGVYPEMLYQNAGYAAAIEAELGSPIVGTKVLWLPTGATKVTVVERDRDEWKQDFKIFESLIELHAHRKGLGAWLKDVREAYKQEQEIGE